MKKSADVDTILALRDDLALQITRHLQRGSQSQAAAAKRLGIPQPTLSQVKNGKVARLSLELLIRIAVRAGLPVTLQTGEDPREAGVFVSALAGQDDAARKSKVAADARRELTRSARALTPQQRLAAQAKHSELIAELHRSGQAVRALR